MNGDDFLTSLGPLGLTIRMKRLVDGLLRDARRLYRHLGIEIEPNWYAVLLLVKCRGPIEICGIAAQLGLRHPSVIRIVKKLEETRLVCVKKDPADARRRLVDLSPECEAQLPDFQVVWDACREVLAELLECAGQDMLASLSILEAELNARPFDVRALDRLHRLSGITQAATPQLAGTFCVRPIAERDHNPVVRMTEQLVRSADTYAFAPDTSQDDLWRYWSGPGRHGYVAILDEEVVGCFVIKPNQPGPGRHVANASYVVREDARGLGLGRRMGEASLALAADLGFRAMQFNIVVSTNHAAVHLWKRLHFRVIGTVPEGFELSDGRFVPYFIMYRSLVDDSLKVSVCQQKR